MSKNLILFVFEGAEKEKQVFNSFKTFFEDANKIVISAYCTTIYSLMSKMSNDDALDLFVLLKNKPENEHLKDYKRKFFDEIYLFFDYDGHATNADDQKLSDALNFFSEETDKGKLYISYPMLEALKHSNDNINFEYLTIPCKQNIRYKKFVNKVCREDLIDFNQYNDNIWKELINLYLMKMNKIVTSFYCLPTKKYTQDLIFKNQLQKHILPSNQVAVLSAFPVFLYDYFNSDYWKTLMK